MTNKNERAEQMLDKDQVYRILKAELPRLWERFHVRELKLFGSYSRSDQSNKSDIDILVTFDEVIDLFEYIKLENELSDLLGYNVDLVMESSLRAGLKDDVEKEAITI